MDSPSFNVVAKQDGTMVTVLPASAIVGGGTLPAGPANMPYSFMLTAGQMAQFSQQADLTGSISAIECTDRDSRRQRVHERADPDDDLL